MPFEIRNESLGPIPPCSLVLRPLTVFTGSDAAGLGLLLRSIFFMAHLRTLIQILWERESEGSVLDQPSAIQNKLAQQAFQGLCAGQSVPQTDTILRWDDCEVLLGTRFNIRSLGTPRPSSLFFPKERLIASMVKNPLARASLGLPLELLQGSRQFLRPGSLPQRRIVELPELSLTPEEQQEEILKLAEWVTRGHTVILGTHSLVVLYQINNLIQASKLPPQEIGGIPSVRHRLPVSGVNAYHLTREQLPLSLMGEDGFISEHFLAQFSRELGDQLAQISLLTGG